MNSPAPAPEEWLTDSVVGKMWELLKNPHKEHGDVACDMLEGQPLLAAHIHELARALVKDKRFSCLRPSDCSLPATIQKRVSMHNLLSQLNKTLTRAMLVVLLQSATCVGCPRHGGSCSTS